jgi:glucose/arabinose dehydrogenase/PKD repeat protein
LYTQAWAQSEFLTTDAFVEDVVLENLPISTTFAFGQDNTIFIALKDGIVRVAQNGSVLPTPFADISSITNRNTDRGLLGLALDPSFPLRPYVYMLHVYDPPDRAQDSTEPRVIRLIRMEADASQNYLVALPDSTEVILGKNSLSEWIAAPFDKNSTIYPEPASCMTGLTMGGTPVDDCLPADAKSHSAGTLLFGPDRSLYVSVGDGSSYDSVNRPALRAQMLDSLAGKILRINPDTGEGVPGNPFYNSSQPDSNRSRVWAYGLRNPFRITLNRITGEVYAGDVGSSSWEEINGGKGANFGWPCYEGGVSPNSPVGESGDTASLVNSSYANFTRTRDLCRPLYALGEAAVRSPVFSYAHQYIDGKDMGGSATGVAFYTAKAYPALYRGSLFIADYSLRWLRFLTFDDFGKARVNNFAREVGSGLGIVDLKTGPDTNLYALYLDLKSRSSQLRRFRYVGDSNIPPRVSLSADKVTGSVPLVVSFRSDGTFDPDGQELEYRWDFGDGSAPSEEKHPKHLFSSVGTYETKLTVREKSTPFASTTRSITIRTGKTPPKAVIDLPQKGSTYVIGDTVTFSGRASFDGADAYPDAALSWAVIQHHNDHTHLEQEISGSGGSFIVEEHADATWYEVCLLVSVDDGLEDQSCQEIFPRKGQLSLLSEPSGAKITYVEEQLDLLTPYSASPIIGSRRSIIAQLIHADRSFSKWSDGATDIQRTFTITSEPSEYKALYSNLAPLAKLTASSLTARVGQTITFDGSGSSDPERTLLGYKWDFGDDAPTSSSPKTQHTYTSQGTYTVTLTVTDKLGSSSKESLLITILPLTTPTPTYTASPSNTPTSTPSLTPTTTPTASATGTPSATPTAKILPTSTASPLPTTTPKAAPSPSPTRVPSATPRTGIDPSSLDLTLLTKGNARCLSSRRPCRILRNTALRLISSTSLVSALSGDRYLASLEVRHLNSRRRVDYSLPIQSGNSTLSQILPGRLFNRYGLYSVRLRISDPRSQQKALSPFRYVRVRDRFRS